MLPEGNEIEIVFRAVDEASDVIQGVNKNIQSFSDETESLGINARDLWAEIERDAQALNGYAVETKIATAQTLDLNKGIQAVGAVSPKTAALLGKLSAVAKTFGVDLAAVSITTTAVAAGLVAVAAAAVAAGVALVDAANDFKEYTLSAENANYVTEESIAVAKELDAAQENVERSANQLKLIFTAMKNAVGEEFAPALAAANRGLVVLMDEFIASSPILAAWAAHLASISQELRKIDGMHVKATVEIDVTGSGSSLLLTQGGGLVRTTARTQVDTSRESGDIVIVKDTGEVVKGGKRASGGYGSGWMLVGDMPGGRPTPWSELVYAPHGARVYSATQTRSMMTGSRPMATGGIMESVVDYDRMGMSVARYLEPILARLTG